MLEALIDDLAELVYDMADHYPHMAKELATIADNLETVASCSGLHRVQAVAPALPSNDR